MALTIATLRSATRIGQLCAPQGPVLLVRRPIRHIHAPARLPSIQQRLYSAEAVEPVEPPEYLSEGERRVFDKIKEGLQPLKLEVQDVSGGCGSMYALDIVSDQFKGMPVIKQHRLVNKVLGEEMKAWHGVQMKTKAP
ncbi:hypothetical protein LTR09_000366 [Extremus antarcticus]|uniref:Bola-like protein n=1 Tax=Extremus antarcticus TaxID=702011 RepID=A0AAJ0LXC6_9PEZI|nr:hypothetical protein LTR09_000366 [Extremus antarcticus]